MSGPDRMVIVGVPLELHMAMCAVTRAITETSGMIGAANAAFSDLVKTYGQLIDQLARYANRMEEARHVAEQVEAALGHMGAEGAEGPAERTCGCTELDNHTTHAAEGKPRGPLGAGDVEPLHTPRGYTVRKDHNPIG